MVAMRSSNELKNPTSEYTTGLVAKSGSFSSNETSSSNHSAVLGRYQKPGSTIRDLLMSIQAPEFCPSQ